MPYPLLLEVRLWSLGCLCAAGDASCLQVVTSDVSVSGFPGRAARREISLSRGARQRCDDRLTQVGAARGLRYEVLRAEQRLLGGALSGYLFGVLGREARAASRAVGGCDGDGTSSCEARRLGAVVCDQQHFHVPGRGRWALALCRLEGCCYSDVDRAWCEGLFWIFSS